MLYFQILFFIKIHNKYKKFHAEFLFPNIKRGNKVFNMYRDMGFYGYLIEKYFFNFYNFHRVFIISYLFVSCLFFCLLKLDIKVVMHMRHKIMHFSVLINKREKKISQSNVTRILAVFFKKRFKGSWMIITFIIIYNKNFKAHQEICPYLKSQQFSNEFMVMCLQYFNWHL